MKTKYKTISFIGVLVLVVVAAGCISLTSMSAGNIAQKMQEKYNTIKDYQGTVVMTTVINGKSKVTESDFKIKKPYKVLLINKETDRVIVSNGTIIWSYLPKKNEVLVMELSKREEPRIGFGTVIKNMMKRFDIKLLGTGKIADRNTYILELVPKNKTGESLGTEKIWVDKKYWMPLKIEGKMKILNETMQFTTSYENIKFNIDIPDSDFQYVIPKGAKVVNLDNIIPKNTGLQKAQKEVNFTIFTPSYLPEGYKFSNAIVFNKIAVAITYKKEGSKIPIQFSEQKGKLKPFLGAEVVNINGNKGYYFSVTTLRNSVLSWTSNNLILTLTSPLPKKEMEKIAESVK
ncbi:lipoprotein chaperone [archaeon]|nr:lipoprotein chaperone [archaeon]